MRSVVNRYTAPIIAAVALGGYWLVAPWVEDNFQAEWLRAAQATVMTVAFVTFVLAFNRAFAKDVPDSARRFYLGLTLWASAADGGTLWRLFWRMAGGGPELNWMLMNDGASFLLWMEIVGVFFMLSGPAVKSSTKPGALPFMDNENISWRRVLLTLGLCLTATYLVVVLRVGSEHIRDMLDYLRPT